MARGTPDALSLGAGYLFIAPTGTTEPSDLATGQGNWSVIAAAWVLLGYTAEGSEFSYALSTDNVEVAEELDPVSIQTTGREASVSFALAEVTATHLKYALNGGTINTAGGVATFEPPDMGSEQRVMLGFESEDHEERWVFRQCFQSGTMKIARKKGADNATIEVEFGLEKPASGKLFKAMFNSTYRA